MNRLGKGTHVLTNFGNAASGALDIIAKALKVLPTRPGDFAVSKDYDPTGRAKALLTGQPYHPLSAAQVKAEQDRVNKVLRLPSYLNDGPWKWGADSAEWFREHWNDHPTLPGQPAPTPSAAPKKTSSSTTQQHVSIGPVSIHVTGGNADAKTIAFAVRSELEKLVPSRNPRNVMAQSGSLRTHASLPLPLTVPLG